MTDNRYRLFQIIVLFGLGFFFFKLITSGKLLFYINIRFAILSFLGMIGFFLLAANALEILRRKRRLLEEDHDHMITNTIIPLPISSGWPYHWH